MSPISLLDPLCAVMPKCLTRSEQNLKRWGPTWLHGHGFGRSHLGTTSPDGREEPHHSSAKGWGMHGDEQGRHLRLGTLGGLPTGPRTACKISEDATGRTVQEREKLEQGYSVGGLAKELGCGGVREYFPNFVKPQNPSGSDTLCRPTKCLRQNRAGLTGWPPPRPTQPGRAGCGRGWTPTCSCGLGDNKDHWGGREVLSREVTRPDSSGANDTWNGSQEREITSS